MEAPMTGETPVAVTVPGGPQLEARLAVPAAQSGGLVICHPHPLYGGDMDNPVVIRVAEVAQALGLTTLRFNFRGAGASGGTHDGGAGEREDARAALAALAEHVPAGRPLGLAGYSFGSWVAARLSMDDAPVEPRVAALGLIAPPLAMLDWSFARPIPHLLLVAGSRDSYCPLEAFRALAARLPGAETVAVDGADHFFFGKLFPLGTAVEAWVRGWAASG
jgi:alpha/beta superfamily hydrolase